MKKTVPITTRALLQRISRVLAKQGKSIKKSRTANMFASVGEYYIVDVNANCISDQRVDILRLGKDLKVLEPFEHVTD